MEDVFNGTNKITIIDIATYQNRKRSKGHLSGLYCMEPEIDVIGNRKIITRHAIAIYLYFTFNNYYQFLQISDQNIITKKVDSYLNQLTLNTHNQQPLNLCFYG